MPEAQAATCDAYRTTNQLRMATRRALEWIEIFEGQAGFCLGTGALRHSAGGIGTFVHTFVCTYMLCIIHNAHARVMEAENSITLIYIYIYYYIPVNTYSAVFIALGWHSEMLIGFHEDTY